MIPASLAPIIARLQAQVENFGSTIVPDAKKYRQEIGEFFEQSQKVAAAATGSWLTPYAALYYQDFTEPPEKDRFVHHGSYIPDSAKKRWHKKSWDDVYQYILANYDGTHPDKATDFTNQAVTRARELADELSAELAALRNLEGFDKELAILDELTSLKWGRRRHQLITDWYPKGQVNIGYQEPMSFVPPPHAQLQASIIQMTTALDDVLTFGRKASLLMRQLSARSSVSIKDFNTYDAIDAISLLCNRFPEVTRQLQYRHDDRPTIIMNDEYDVQDLMHSLLKLYFDDVREEEWTPSYAGGSSRIDFLLKDSEIALEIKKTREGLRDSKVGEQLIIDIEKYRSHPNTKTLICFVYDPQHFIRNPRGLENDLSGQRDGLDVRVLIR
jgi:hypothetical protein